MVVDMASINNMYMVSLQQFLELHDFSVNHSEKAPIAAKRIINIMDYMTNYVTRYMHRGHHRRHRCRLCRLRLGRSRRHRHAHCRYPHHHLQIRQNGRRHRSSHHFTT